MVPPLRFRTRFPFGWTPIPGEGPLGKGPGVGSGRSSGPAGGTGQTGIGWAKGRLQRGTTDKGVHSNKRKCIAVQEAGYFGAREVEINAGQTGGTTTVYGARGVEIPHFKVPAEPNSPISPTILPPSRASPKWHQAKQLIIP